ncbi:MAG: conjugal transfer protein TrbI [Alphaproteobacteria bacterium]|nr:conjugal transfer protein TrbI [Alphaproteobacteria bacterium]
MTEAIQDDKPLDESLLNQDLNGAAAPKKGGALSIKGTPREGGARLSRNFKKIAFVGGSVVVGGMVIGILTAGNKSQPAESSGTTAMVGQTSPDVAAMQRAAQQHLGGPVAASSDPTGNAASAPVGAASSPGAPLNHVNNPGAALHASGEPPQLTPAQKYRRWLIEQHYKELEGAILADQTAHLAKTSAGSVGMLSGIQSGAAAPSQADALRKLTALAATPQSAADPNLQKALAALQGASGLAGADQSPQAQNKAFLAAQDDKTSNGYLDAAAQPPISNHELFAGAVIPAVMLTGIDSDLPGTITAQVRQTVYDSLNPTVVLIPQGTRIIGEYGSDVAYGQSRVLVAWNRLIFPNDAMMDLKGMSGTDAEGQAGFHDQVDNHYMRIFGSAILMSLLGVGAQLSQPQNAGALNTPSASQQAASALAQQMDSVGANLLNKNLSIQPTLTIRPGYAFDVLVNRTMILPSYPGG